jgi:hypothetical protein
VAGRTNTYLTGARSTAPEFAVRFVGALLAVAVAAVHVADQGGITAMVSPAWIGWGYRLAEAGGVLTALVLLLPGLARPGQWGPSPVRLMPGLARPGQWGPSPVRLMPGLARPGQWGPGAVRLMPAWLSPAALGWAAGLMLGAGPFAAYVTSRTVGLPGDPGDVGNWGDWVGTVSLLVEAALVMLSVSMLRAARRHH